MHSGLDSAGRSDFSASVSEDRGLKPFAAKVADDPDRMIPNPAKNRAIQAVKASKDDLTATKDDLTATKTAVIDTALGGAGADNAPIDAAADRLAEATAAAKAIPRQGPPR